jgi:hypothetical protein
VEGIDMSEVEGMNMVKEQDHPTNHRLRDEGMNMVGSNMMKVNDMDTMEEHFYLMNHRPEVEGMDMVEAIMEPTRTVWMGHQRGNIGTMYCSYSTATVCKSVFSQIPR